MARKHTLQAIHTITGHEASHKISGKYFILQNFLNNLNNLNNLNFLNFLNY